MSAEANRSPIVWVVEKASFDYSPARVYGQTIRAIEADQLSPNADASWHDKTIQQVRKALSDYIPGIDYIIPTGKPVRMMLVGLILRERGDVHNFLGWDDRTQRYFVYEIDLRRDKAVPGRHINNRG